MSGAASTPASACVLGRVAMRDLDARTIAAGTPSLELMERAGLALADGLCDPGLHGVALPERPRLLVLAGRGNNGGDGFVVARLLASRRWRCTVALVAGEPAPGGDAAVNLAECRRIGGAVVGREQALRDLAAGATGYDLALDCVFGTGLERDVAGADADLIRCLNESGLPVVSADIPSGLCSDRGVPLGEAVRARATLAIGAAKTGLFLGRGPDFAGRVRVADIGLLAPAAAGLDVRGTVLDSRTTAGLLPRLGTMAHKGNRGHVLIVAGSRGKGGAALLAARAALRAGAGLVTVACVPDVQAAVAASLPEAMTLALAHDGDGQVGEAAAAALLPALEAATAVVVGPGLGAAPAVDRLVETVLGSGRASVLDADALNAVSRWDPGRRREAFASRREAGAPAPILTPHPGEMSRLVARPVTDVQRSRDEYAARLAEELASVVVLKGAATVVASPGGLAFNLSGNPGMGAAGMGDVLAGACGALLARLGDPELAARLAVYAHGAAGDIVEAGTGAGFLASELADSLPAVLRSLHPR